MSPGISPGDNEKSGAIPSCGKRRSAFLAVNVARHLLGDDNKSCAILSCGTRRPAFSAVNVTRHLARRQQEVPCDPFLRGEAACTFCIPGRQRRPASRQATTRSPARSLLAGRGGLHSWPSMSPGILPGNDKKSRATSTWGEATNTFGRCRRPASRPATTSNPARPLCGARQPALSAVAIARLLARRRQEVPRDLFAG